MRQEGEWLPGFIPEELVNEFKSKVEKPKQRDTKFKFENHNGEERWFLGFVKTIDGHVLRKAADAGLRATINEEDFEGGTEEYKKFVEDYISYKYEPAVEEFDEARYFTRDFDSNLVKKCRIRPSKKIESIVLK